MIDWAILRFILTVIFQIVTASWVWHCHRTKSFRSNAFYFIISYVLFIGNIYAVLAGLHYSFSAKITQEQATIVLLLIVLTSLPLGLLFDRFLIHLGWWQ